MLAELRAHGLKIGLVSNTGRDLDAFVAHHALDVDAAVGSGAHGKTKPHPDDLPGRARRSSASTAEEAAMVGDSPEDDIEGARALGMRAFLVDREDRFPEVDDAPARPAGAAGGARPQRQAGSAGRLSPKPQTCSSTT